MIIIKIRDFAVFDFLSSLRYDRFNKIELG